MEIRHRSKEYFMLEDIPMIGPVAAYSLVSTGIITIIVIFMRFPQHNLLAFWGLLVAILGIILLFRLREQTRIFIDRSRQKLLIVRKKPLGASNEKTYELSDVQSFKIETNLKKNGQRLVAQLKNETEVPLTAHFKSGQSNSYPGLCRTINKYISINES